MLTSIDVKFTFDSARLGFFRSANVLQIADVALVLTIISPSFTLETSKMSAIFCFHNQNNSTLSSGLLG